MAATSASRAVVTSWPAAPVVATAKMTRALLVSKRPGNHSTLVNQKKKKNLALPTRTQWYASPWAPLSLRVLEGEEKSEEGRGEGRWGEGVREEGR